MPELYPLTACPRHLLGSKRFAALRPLFEGGIDLASNDDEEAREVHPGEEDDHCANAAIRGIIRSKIVHIIGKSKGGNNPGQDGKHRPWCDPPPLLLDI